MRNADYPITDDRLVKSNLDVDFASSLNVELIRVELTLCIG